MPRKGEVSLNVDIPISLKKRLDAYCKREGLKIKAVVRKALEKYLDERGA